MTPGDNDFGLLLQDTQCKELVREKVLEKPGKHLNAP